ncbi:hypothetical protein [Yoonia sp.]|uniref:hypothetical protein n=1 Tax=Yoonia sp. TaxID=2212373 RepID=UPI00289D0769|nr:hypothetical protein [Yoonia sp.]
MSGGVTRLNSNACIADLYLAKNVRGWCGGSLYFAVDTFGQDQSDKIRNSAFGGG